MISDPFYINSSMVGRVRRKDDHTHANVAICLGSVAFNQLIPL